MKNIFKILTLLLVVFSVAIAMIGCQEEPVYDDYTVTVVDGLGNPMSNVMVKFTNPDGETKTRVTDKDGLAVLKNVLCTDYAVALEKGFSDAVIDQASYTLTKEVRTLKAVVRDEKKTFDIYGEIPEGTFAYRAGVGSYDIVMEANGAFYLVFYAQTRGTYKVTLTSDDSDATVGFYGIPLFVQSTHRGDGEYDGKSFELVIQDSETPYVIGIKTIKAGEAHLTIERAGDAPFDPNYLPWTEVESNADLVKCDTTGKTLVDVDIADSDLTVSLGDDGYYYTSGGKLVYVRITSATGYTRFNAEEQQYVPVLNGSLALLCGHVDANVGTNFGGYVYENGEFVGKYRYNSMIGTYKEYVDSSYGVVPLTEELAKALKLHGEHNGWWNPDSYGYLFDGIRVNHDNAWLFLCMIEQ